jgi:hypothetical protein
MNWITLILTFLVLYLVMTNKPSYADTDPKKVRVAKSLDALKDRSQNWLSASVDTLRALYDSVTSMASNMVRPKTSSYCGPCASGIVMA